MGSVSFLWLVGSVLGMIDIDASLSVLVYDCIICGSSLDEYEQIFGEILECGGEVEAWGSEGEWHDSDAEVVERGGDNRSGGDRE